MTKKKGTSKRKAFTDAMKPKGKAANKRKHYHFMSVLEESKRARYKLIARQKNRKFK
jgi:hypothetical protein